MESNTKTPQICHCETFVSFCQTFEPKQKSEATNTATFVLWGAIYYTWTHPLTEVTLSHCVFKNRRHVEMLKHGTNGVTPPSKSHFVIAFISLETREFG